MTAPYNKLDTSANEGGWHFLETDDVRSGPRAARNVRGGNAFFFLSFDAPKLIT